MMQLPSMRRFQAYFSMAILAVAYGAAASIMLVLTRFDGGVAFLWLASSILIAHLILRPRREWSLPLAGCAIASAIATGLFGFGWQAAIPFAIANMAEAAIAAWLFRRYCNSRTPLGSLSWVFTFVLAVGIIGPLASASIAVVFAASSGAPPLSSFFNFFVGHGLGNITFTPIAILFARGGITPILREAGRRSVAEGIVLLGVVGAVSAAVFSQSGLPLLFLPMLPVMLVTFRLGQFGTAMAIVIVALVGGGFTLSGAGPIHLVSGTIGQQVQFFQLYLAATVLSALPVTADLHNRARLHRELRHSEERYRLLADHSTDIMMHIDLDGRIRFVSPSIVQLGGYHPAELVGRNATTLVAVEYLPQFRDGHRRTIMAAGRTHKFEYIAITRDGSSQWFETHSKAILGDDGEVESVLSIIRNVNQRKYTEDRLRMEAQTDPLTGLANRRALDALIESRQAQNELGAPNCLAVLDIDHFKRVNDLYGHATGDEVLRTFAQVARRIVRQEDIVARIGGEEFALFFPNTSIDQAMLVCDRLRAEMAATSLVAHGVIVRVTISGGVAAVGEGGFDYAFKVADEALYRAKSAGRDQLALAA